MDLKRELDKLKLELIMTKPFFGNVLYSLEFKEKEGLEAAVKADGLYISYDASYISSKKLSVSKLRYLIMHEVYHILLLHEYRRENRKGNIWDISTDMVIEYRLHKLIGTEFSYLNPPPYYDPELGLYLNKFIVFDEKDFERESEESIYNKLSRNYEKNSGEIKYKDRVFALNLEKTEIESRSRLESITDREQVINQKSKIESIIAESITKDRLAGNKSIEGSKILGMIEGKKIDWKKHIRRQLQTRFSEDTSFSYPDNRFQWKEIVIPDFEPREDFLELLIILDLSSSIDRSEINQMLFQIKALSEQFELKARVLGFSTQVVMDAPLNQREVEKNIEKYSFGGTDWNCIPQYIKEKKIKYSFAITITDGSLYSKPSDIPNHLWLITAGNKMNYAVRNRVIEI
jgi:predicted metal-dependent peptidase